MANNPIRHIISVDPGDVNNGFCYFKHNAETGIADLRIMKVCTPEEVSKLLRTLWGVGEKALAENREREVPQKNPANFFFVVENFRMDSHVRGAVFQWNELLTSQMIGRVKLCAEWMDAPVFMQEPQILAIRKKDAPFKVAKGHLKDDHSAFLHGAHFMLTKKLIRTVDDIVMFGQQPF